MNKKAYIIPNTEVVNVSTNSMVCSSFSSIGGDAGVIYGGEETTPVEGADSRSLIWDDEE